MTPEFLGLVLVALAVLALAYVLARRPAGNAPDLSAITKHTLDVADRCLTAYEQGLNRGEARLDVALQLPIGLQLNNLREAPPAVPAPEPESPPYVTVGKNAIS